MGLSSRVPFALGFLVALVALAALVLAPRSAAAQDKPWRPKVHKPKRVGKPTPPQNKPPATEVAKPPTNNQAAEPQPLAPGVTAPTAQEVEAQRRAGANPFPGSVPEVTAPTAGVTQAAGPAAATPEVVEPARQVSEPSTLDRFVAALSPHGTWVDEADHGDVWLPDPAKVGAAFAPYRTSGHWALTDQDDWAWVSDFDWGQVPFHYGRWDWNAQRGWGWVPDTDWAPAWVVWRLGQPGFDYVGWAPAPPAKTGTDGARSTGGSAPVLPFWYVPSSKLFHPQVNDHVVTDRKLGRAIHDHSAIFAQHLAGSSDATALTTASLQALRPASPTPAAARIPKRAIPKTRLQLSDPSQGREADDSLARRGAVPPKRVMKGRAFRSRRLRPVAGAGRMTPPKLRHRVTSKKVHPRPRQRCRRWVRTWSGALRCSHR